MRALLIAAMAATLFMVGCGGGTETHKTTPTPTSVSSDDLTKDGAFWNSLTPDLKDELIGYGKTQLAENRTDGASGIQAMDTDQLVGEVDKSYTNASKRSEGIFATYIAANNKIAGEDFSKTMNEIETLKGTQ